jgi:RNA polymerase sigma factor (sigma-70 family)
MPVLPMRGRVPSWLSLPVNPRSRAAAGPRHGGRAAATEQGQNVMINGTPMIDAGDDGDAAQVTNEADGGLSPAVLDVLMDNRDRFLGFLQRRVQRRDLAEEILQDAFVRSISAGASLRDDESAVAWFYRLLRNALVDRFRHDAAQRRALDALAADAAAPLNGEPDADLCDAICNCLLGLLPTLKPVYAEVLSEVELGDQTLEAFATGAAISRGNAAVRLFRARQALRRRVEQSCGSCATHGCYQCECADAHRTEVKKRRRRVNPR